MIDGVAAPLCILQTILNLNASSSAGAISAQEESKDDIVDKANSQPGVTIQDGPARPAPTRTRLPPAPPLPPRQSAMPAINDEQRRRRKLANQVTGLVMGYYEERPPFLRSCPRAHSDVANLRTAGALLVLDLTKILNRPALQNTLWQSLLQAQRAGPRGDTAFAYPQIWQWEAAVLHQRLSHAAAHC